MNAKEIAENNEILRGVVGSTAYGTSLDDKADRDEMGIFIEPQDCVMGLNVCDHYIHRDQPDGVKSKPGDLERTMYSLRKFVGLAAKGNPTVMELLWLPKHESTSIIGEDLINMREEFISRDAGFRFLGYLTSQKMRLTGERTRNVNRPELVEAYGYDTKFAMQALRLGYEGCRLLKEGRLEFPLPLMERENLKAIRLGKLTLKEALECIEEVEAELKTLAEACTKEVDMDEINNHLVWAHQLHWRKISTTRIPL